MPFGYATGLVPFWPGEIMLWKVGIEVEDQRPVVQCMVMGRIDVMRLACDIGAMAARGEPFKVEVTEAGMYTRSFLGSSAVALGLRPR